jgi:hypothetical protein
MVLVPQHRVENSKSSMLVNGSETSDRKANPTIAYYEVMIKYWVMIGLINMVQYMEMIRNRDGLEVIPRTRILLHNLGVYMMWYFLLFVLGVLVLEQAYEHKICFCSMALILPFSCGWLDAARVLARESHGGAMGRRISIDALYKQGNSRCMCFLSPYKSQIFIMITGTAFIAVLIYDW